MLTKNILYFLACTFVLCKSFSVDTLTKCSIKDKECLIELYQKMIKEVAKPGIPELDIPPLDPVAIKDVTVSVLNLVNLTMADGVVKGIKNCVVNSFDIDIDKGIGKQEIMCDLTIKGHYMLVGSSPTLKTVLGNGDLKGDGNGKVKLEKLILSMQYKFYPEKHEDGEIYLMCLCKEIEYSYDIKGKASFAADNIYVGKDDISEMVIKYLNENWKFLLRTFGKSFIDKAMEFYLDFAQKFFHGVPARHFIIEDLTPYLKE